jgi:hypothetical protein
VLVVGAVVEGLVLLLVKGLVVMFSLMVNDKGVNSPSIFARV